MELTWIGQSGFRLRDPETDTTAFVDPFISAHRSRVWQPPVSPADLAQADLVLCTHQHIDHFDQPALKAASGTPGARFILVVPEPIVDMALELGIPRERIAGAQPGRALEWPHLRVHPVPASHGVNVSDAYNFGQELSNGMVRYLGYVVELGGVRAYHAGDTIPYPGQTETLRPYNLDLALLPINGRDYFRETERNLVGNMDLREAARAAVDMGAPVLVPMHWEMFPHNRGFPGDLVSYVEEHFPELTVLVFGRGQKVLYR